MWCVELNFLKPWLCLEMLVHNSHLKKEGKKGYASQLAKKISQRILKVSLVFINSRNVLFKVRVHIH